MLETTSPVSSACVRGQGKASDEYYELCKRDNRLSPEPELRYKCKFVNWIDYLSIPRKYYTTDECKRKIAEFSKLNPELLKDRLDISGACMNLCSMDDKFPPNGLWVEYYGVKDINELFVFPKKKKCSILL